MENFQSVFEQICGHNGWTCLQPHKAAARDVLNSSAKIFFIRYLTVTWPTERKTNNYTKHLLNCNDELLKPMARQEWGIFVNNQMWQSHCLHNHSIAYHIVPKTYWNLHFPLDSIDVIVSIFSPLVDPFGQPKCGFYVISYNIWPVLAFGQS